MFKKLNIVWFLTAEFMKVSPLNFRSRAKALQDGFSFLESIVVMAIIVLMVWIIIPGWKLQESPKKDLNDLGIFKAENAKALQPGEIELEKIPENPPVQIEPSASEPETLESPDASASVPAVETVPEPSADIAITPPALETTPSDPNSESTEIPSTPIPTVPPSNSPSTGNSSPPPVFVPEAPSGDSTSTVIPASPAIEIPTNPPVSDIPLPPPPTP